jgi:hypothetical protein
MLLLANEKKLIKEKRRKKKISVGTSRGNSHASACE